MDGTLVDFTAGVSGAWDLFKKERTDVHISRGFGQVRVLTYII